MIRILLIGLFLFCAPAVHADIYKCVDGDGSIAYQQTPCPVEDKVPEVGETQAPDVKIEVSPTAEEVEACKDPLRDAIDGIEAEMLSGYSPEQGEEFKQQLRGLTDEMRACE